MAGLLDYARPTMGEEGGAGAGMQVPEGLGPEATQMFHNPSATNWMNYKESYPSYPGFNYYGAEDFDPLMQGLLDQGYGQFTQGYEGSNSMYGAIRDWDDVGSFGKRIAGTVMGSFPKPNLGGTGLTGSQYNVQDIVERIHEYKNFEEGTSYEEDYQTSRNHPWNFPSQGHVAQDILKNKGY